MGGNAWTILRSLNQERIVLVVAVLIFVAAVDWPCRASSPPTIWSPSSAPSRCSAFWRSAWRSSSSAAASTCRRWRSWRCRSPGICSCSDDGMPDGCGPGAGAGRRPRHRAAQRLSRRLCRRSGDLRDAGQRLLRLRLCPLAADHAGRGAGAARPLGRAARRPALCSTCRSRSSSSPAWPSRPSCSCASPNGAATSITPATIPWRRATSAFRCGR